MPCYAVSASAAVKAFEPRRWESCGRARQRGLGRWLAATGRSWPVRLLGWSAGHQVLTISAQYRTHFHVASSRPAAGHLFAARLVEFVLDVARHAAARSVFTGAPGPQCSAAKRHQPTGLQSRMSTRRRPVHRAVSSGVRLAESPTPKAPTGERQSRGRAVSHLDVAGPLGESHRTSRRTGTAARSGDRLGQAA